MIVGGMFFVMFILLIIENLGELLFESGVL